MRVYPSAASVVPEAWKNCVNGTSAGGWCSIENLAHTLCLGAVTSGDGTNGDTVELVRCPYVGEPIAQKEAETWTYLQSDFGGITAASLVNFAHYLCLDANNNGSGQNGDKVQLWHCLDQPNQGWGLDAPFNSNLRALPMPRCKPGGGRQHR
jgi:hypothetical protein